MAIGAGFLLPDKLWPFLVVIAALETGWVGTERISYLRAFREKPIRAAELWRFTRSFVVRHCALGVAVGIPLVVVLSVLSLTGVLPRVPSEGPLGPSLITLYVLSVIIDVALTFVTPALAFTTQKVKQALRIGLGMIRQDGNVARSFGSFDHANAVALQADGKMVAAGFADGDFALARYKVCRVSSRRSSIPCR